MVKMKDLNYSLIESTAPAFEPITLAEARDQASVDSDVDDALINSYIKAARIYATNINGRGMARATYTLTAPRFPTEFILPRPPFSTVTSIKYYDTNGTQQTLADTVYSVDTGSEPGRVVLAYNQSWPTIRDVYNAVQVVYVSGYASAAAVPENFKQAMRMLIAHWFEYREPIIVGGAVSNVPLSVETLLMTDRLNAYGMV